MYCMLVLLGAHNYHIIINLLPLHIHDIQLTIHQLERPTAHAAACDLAVNRCGYFA